MGVAAPEREHSSPDATAFGREPSERQVGKYRILAELGRGGTATVYLAIARGHGVHKLVVLKALLPEFAGDPVALSMFLDEARLAAQLNHANIVQTYEIGSEGGRNVIVMEYLEGQSLSRILRYAERAGEPLSVPMQLRILTNALEGLHYAHELPAYDGTPLLLVHRDVSPQNVFVTYDGQVKLLDFGIAKASTSADRGAGLIKGKIAYMAPEQMLGQAVDRRADVFSVGCMLWAVAAGTRLWRDAPDVQIVRRVTRGEIPSPKTVNPSCPDELERITMRALSFDPNARYATALDMQMELERYAEAADAPVRQRELGRLVSRLFGSARAELRDNIERQLAALSAEDSTDYALRPPSDTSELRRIDRTREASSPPAAQRRRLLPWLALPLVFLLGAGFMWLTAKERASREGANTHSEVHGARPALGLTAPAPATQGTAATPEPAATLSATATAASSAAATATTAAKPAATPRWRRAQPPSSARARASAVVAPAPSAPPMPSCQNPFYLDSEGIKRFRPECL